jgi:beta-mannosidase
MKLDPAPSLSRDDLIKLAGHSAEGSYSAAMPEQVQQILIRNGVIDDPAITLDASLCRWVGDFDWLYYTDFGIPAGKGPFFIVFMGLDTFADIYLNGELIYKSINMYTPVRIDVSEK